jgi:MFS family permease
MLQMTLRASERSVAVKQGVDSMAMPIPSTRGTPTIGWRTPAVILLCGCLVSLVSFGPRATLGFFLTPQSQANGWGRDVFGLALALQNLMWGIGQPFAGAIADRYGTMRVLCVGQRSMPSAWS